MMWLWLLITWLAFACALGTWLGGVLRAARLDEVRDEVAGVVDLAPQQHLVRL